MNFQITVDPDKELGVELRQLHEALESRREFATWAKDKLAGFEENIDFGVSDKIVKNSGGRPRKDYAVSIDVAKHIAMMENTERGREVRRYFIDCEKQLREAIPAPAQLTKMEILEMALDSERKVQQLERQNARLLPDAQFGQELKDTDDLLCMTEVSNPLQLSAQALNDFLKKRKVIFDRPRYGKKEWFPCSGYKTSGYFKVLVHIFEKDGESKTRHQLKVTGKGRAFIHDLWRKHNKQAA